MFEELQCDILNTHTHLVTELDNKSESIKHSEASKNIKHVSFRIIIKERIHFKLFNSLYA